jgi:dihydrofolate reductase
MSTIVVQAFVTLDGVVQGGGAPDEDRENGFELGGWAIGHDTEMDPGGEMDRIVGEWEERTDALLLGRKTYEIFARSWGVWDENADGLQGQLTRRYNRVPKYVASRTLTDLGWKGSELLGDDIPAEVRALRAKPGREIRVWGSTELIRILGEHDLVDEYRLAVYPVVLGTGKKLFADGFTHRKLVVAETRAIRSGVVITTYRRSGPPLPGSGS